MLKAFFVPLFFLLLSGCSQPNLIKETRFLMDTLVEISVYSADRPKALEAVKQAFLEIERIEKIFSRFDKDSEISRVNTLAGIKETKLSSELFGLIKDSLYYSQISEGAFDITAAPLVDVWAIARRDGVVPDSKTIESTLEYVGYKNIKLDGERSSVHFLDKRTRLDFGGIAKGYAVDRTKETLLSHGIKNALINIGGNIFALGSPPGRKAWRIGIQHPRYKNKIIFKLNLKNRAAATSGDYERFFTLDKKRFSHIINPLDGWPVQDVMSVTVVAATAEAADALSTAFFVTGAENSQTLIRSFDDIEVFMFDKESRFIKYP
ncbi:MAG: FAD:protein FMN transferase [Candidatus Omnitrophica bacterium]|nr:FAD:protein FMN transferase [Candidatus Omnitrophota bacterium]